jgi:SAM-dependent methyltransferase
VSETFAPYFENHARRTRFPWSLYHAPIERALARILRSHGPTPTVLVVGCGLEPDVEGAPRGATFFACDLDPRAIDACREARPDLAARLAVCPGPYALPTEPAAFAGPFDVVLAKEVVEHLEAPERFTRELARRVKPGGELVLTTPNYGALSTLPLLERTALEWVARRDGFTRRHIHPTKLTRATLATLDVGPGMRLLSITPTWTRWTLVARWGRAA